MEALRVMVEDGGDQGLGQEFPVNPHVEFSDDTIGTGQGKLGTKSSRRVQFTLLMLLFYPVE